jgi:hypothetical protein
VGVSWRARNIPLLAVGIVGKDGTSGYVCVGMFEIACVYTDKVGVGWGERMGYDRTLLLSFD